MEMEGRKSLAGYPDVVFEQARDIGLGTGIHIVESGNIGLAIQHTIGPFARKHQPIAVCEHPRAIHLHHSVSLHD